MNIHSIRVRITALSTACILATTGAMVSYQFVSSTRTQKFVNENVESLLNKTVKSHLEELAAVQASHIKSSLDTAFDAARNMGRSLEVMASDPTLAGTALSKRRDQLNALLVGVLKDNPRFNGTYSAWEPNAIDGQDDQYRNKKEAGSDTTGRALPYWTRSSDGHIDVQPLVEYDSTDLHPNGVMKGAWYINPKAGKGESILDPLPYIVQGKNVYLATMSVPIMVDGKFMGVAGADFDLAFVQALATEVSQKMYSGKAQATIVSHMGLIVASSAHPELIGSSIEKVGRNRTEDLRIIEAGQRNISDQPENEMIDVFSPISIGRTKTPWSVMISVPRAVVLAEATQLGGALASRSVTDTMWQLIMSAAAAVIAIGFLGVMAHGIVRPIEALTRALRSIAEGRLTEPVTGRDRRDEIGEIARAVEGIQEKTAETARLEAESKETATRIAAEQRKSEMSNLANRFESTVGSIIQFVTSASNQLETAAVSLTKTAVTTQELSGSAAATSEQTSANVQSVAAASEQLASTVTEIGRQTQEASSIAQGAVKQAHITNDRVIELSNSANRIGDVVGLINSIASQTNLLALNATIEAARAGDAGKGFAVVAQEVKTLAAQTAKATDEIAQQIASMQMATKDAVSAIGDISVTINKVSEISGAIASAVVEQGATTTEITRNVTEAAKGTNDVANSMSNVNRGASETGAASAQVLNSAKQLSEQSQTLRQEVANFLESVRAA